MLSLNALEKYYFLAIYIFFYKHSRNIYQRRKHRLNFVKMRIVDRDTPFQTLPLWKITYLRISPIGLALLKNYYVPSNPFSCLA